MFYSLILEKNILTGQISTSGANHLSHSGGQILPMTITEPTNSMSEKQVLQTMEGLMSSMNSGDWSSIMPDQFYSLIDSLQEMEGLDQKDIDSLEESYTNYLKLQGTFDYLENDDVELKADLLQPSHNSVQQGGFRANDSRVSPHGSPYSSPLPPPLQQSPNMLAHGRLSPANSNSSMPSLMDSNELNQVLQPIYGNSMNSINQNMLAKSPSSSNSMNGTLQLNTNQMNGGFNMTSGMQQGSPLNHYRQGSSPSPQPPPSYPSPQPHYTPQGSPATMLNQSNEMNANIVHRNQPSPQQMYQQHSPHQQQQQQQQRQQSQHQGHPSQQRRQHQKSLYTNVEDEEEEFDWNSIM